MNIQRKLIRNWKWFSINTIGLSTALACVVIISLYVRKELSYDRFHTNADRIYRITLNNNTGETAMHAARVFGDWPSKIADEHPVVEKVVRLIPYRRAVVKIGTNHFYSESVFATDSTFFQVFDFKVNSGNHKTAFIRPHHAWISKSLAEKYFGSTDVIGKEISVSGDQSGKMSGYTIEGVLEDFPDNSHFHADILTSATEFADQPMWAYTYFQISSGTDINGLIDKIHAKFKKESNGVDPVPVVYLQKLTDIHLHSHKTRELENNGDMRSVILLLSGALIVLIIALVNFLNLSRVQFISNIKTFKVKLINGASVLRLSREIATDSLMTSILSVGIGLLIAFKLSESLNLHIFRKTEFIMLILISLSLILLVAALSIIPLHTTRIERNLKITGNKGRLYAFPLVFQFTLSVIAISSTIVLNRQLNFIGSQHPESQNPGMLVIPYNPQAVVKKYDLLKSELLKNPEIIEVSSAMEEPGGDINDAFPFEMEGIQSAEKTSINILTTDSGFFDFMKIKPLAGTTHLGYTPSQEWEEAAMELGTLKENKIDNPQRISELEKIVGNYREKYILNESALKLLGIKNPESAIGKRFRLTFFMPYLFPEGEIIGIVPDFHYTNLHNKERPLVIAPRRTFSSNFLISIDPNQQKQAIAALRTTWERVNPDFPLSYQYITDSYKKVYTQEHNQARVMSLFALISILLSALGVFAIASFNIQSRIKEIGIRKVNGARTIEILGLLNKDLVKWIVLAFVIATPLAWYTMDRWLQNFAYKTELNGWIFLLAGMLAMLTALITVSWKSWIAASRNPVESLRYE